MVTADGELVGVLGIARDISDREKALDESRQLAAIVKSSDDAIIGKAIDGTVTSWNPAAERLFGFSAAEMIGHSLVELLSPERLAEDGRALQRNADELTVERIETTWRHKNGTMIDVAVTISPISGNDGVVIGSSTIAREIGQRKKAEAELVRYRDHLEELVAERTADLETANRLLVESRDAAEQANRAKTVFLSNMSHEIRTPMNAVLGMVYLLRQSGLTPGQMARLDRIDAASRHLMSVINDILDLSKIEAGKLVLRDEPVSIEALMGSVCSIVGELARAKNLTLDVQVDTFPPALRGDLTRLQQALLNYATNAIKFTEVGHVSLRAVLLDASERTVQVRFEVEDSGIGIAPEALPRLFRAFEQVDESNTRAYGGTGLGLAITRRLARLMGGDAGVSSRLGDGSAFWFTARLARGGDEQEIMLVPVAELERQIRERHAGRRILIVDDAPFNQEVAGELLANVELNIDLADNGIEAVTATERAAYDLILMDIQMPDMDGIEATREIRARGGTTMPILAMTANAFPEDQARYLAAGLDDFLPKPLEPARFYATVLKWLDQRKAAAGAGGTVADR